MPVKKVRRRWIAPLDPKLGFTVEQGQPTGIFVHDQESFGVMLQYAGVEGGEGFILPRDKKALRALARALTGFAGDSDHVDQ